jgi:hypothetical protein
LSLLGQSALSEFAFQKRKIDIRRRQYPANIAQVFFAAAFAKKFQFMNDDILWRSEPNGRFADR